MKHFWCTSDTIPDGLGFSHFSAPHLLWLAALVAICVVCGFAYRRLDAVGRGRMRKAVALLLVADELFKLIPMLIMDVFHVKYLPFQLCSINIFLIVWHAWKPGKTVGSFLYTVCIPGAVAAMLFPTWTKLPQWNYMLIHSFLAHILLILYPVMLTAAGEIRPRLREVPKCLALLLGLAGVALVLNLLWDTNFMFLMEADDGNPLVIFERLWGSHLLGFPVIIAGVIFVMYAPIEIYHAVRKRKTVKTA